MHLLCALTESVVPIFSCEYNPKVYISPSSPTDIFLHHLFAQRYGLMMQICLKGVHFNGPIGCYERTLVAVLLMVSTGSTCVFT